MGNETVVKNLTACTLELGGKSPTIMLRSALWKGESTGTKGKSKGKSNVQCANRGRVRGRRERVWQNAIIIMSDLHMNDSFV
jgi:acyl-CoA reductase-like NAD-dependent aldehyde dehydrogenase